MNNTAVKAVKIAIPSFPGNNCEVESIRAIRQSGMEPVFFRWNDSRDTLQDVDGYFIPGGFSYEDRGRAGMVAARDPLLDFIGQEAEAGKVVIGNCNGAQILVESGLIPLGKELQMSLAQNVSAGEPTGFLSEWIWVTPSCPQDRCVTANWEGTMHMPIAHGEGRFTTKDKDLLKELEIENQLAFHYCSEDGIVSEDPIVTPNGSVYAVAGICNPTGNVVALMPHPERTPNGKPYFDSVRQWIETKNLTPYTSNLSESVTCDIPTEPSASTEIFIDTIITNNEERTVEQAARRICADIRIQQLRYMALRSQEPQEYLGKISFFNPNKERAYIRQGSQVYLWNVDEKRLEQTDIHPLEGMQLLRTDDINVNEGICYVCRECTKEQIVQTNLAEIFANPHASRLVFLA